MNEERIEKRFDVQANASLLVSNVRGQIEIQPGEDGVIEVVAVKDKNSGDSERTQITIEQDTEGRVNVRTDYPDRTSWLSWGRPCKVTYQVRVPRQCSLKLKAVSSTISACEVSGPVMIRSVSGAVDLHALTGDIDIRSISGAVKTAKLNGTIKLDTVSGSVQLMDADVPRIRAKTVSGAVTLQTTMQEGPYEFDSVSGRVTLIVPAEAACSARLKSMSGRIKTTLPGSQMHRNGRESRISIGEGGPQVSLKSVSGNLHIVTSESEVHEAVVVKPVVKKIPEPDRMAVLDRIERGEINVDQAIRELT